MITTSTKAREHSPRTLSLIQKLPPRAGHAKPRERILCKLAFHRDELLVLRFGPRENAYVAVDKITGAKTFIVNGFDGFRVEIPLELIEDIVIARLRKHEATLNVAALANLEQVTAIRELEDA